MEPKTKTRRPTAAERLAARVLGRPEPDEVAVDATPTAALHAERLTDPRESEKPAGMQTADWYARRATGGDDPPRGEKADAGGEDEPRPLPRWARRMVYRPDGGGAA